MTTVLGFLGYSFFVFSVGLVAGFAAGFGMQRDPCAQPSYDEEPRAPGCCGMNGPRLVVNNTPQDAA